MKKRNGSSGRQNEIYSWVESAIYEAELLPGDVIDEQILCRKFDVSRTPVREALLQLASRNLISFVPRKGAIVTKLSVKEIVPMWEVLTGLEVMACELAARRMKSEERSALETLHLDSEKYTKTDDIEGYFVANRQFHKLIHEGSRNTYLVGEIRNLRLRLRSYGRRPYQRVGGLKVSFNAHSAILQAILEGNVDAAGWAMQDHVSGGFSLLDFLADAANQAHE